MTSGRRNAGRGSVVRIDSAQHTMTRKKAVGLTEEERQIPLDELAEITAELDALRAQAKEVTARVHRAQTSPAAREEAYRLLRAVLMTAVTEDKILARNPCQVRGAGTEVTPERPTLTVPQVFELAERVGVRPVGNIRKLDSGEFRLRYRVKGDTMRRHPATFATRPDAERALWELAEDGRADVVQDDRLRAFILLAAFASLRWGEVTALRRADVDTVNRTVRVRAAYVERANGEMILGPTKSQAGLWTVAIPAAIVPDLEAHLESTSGRTLTHSSSRASRAGRCGGAASTGSPAGASSWRRSGCRTCTSTTFATPATPSPLT